MKLINQFWYIWDVFNQIVFSSNRILWILIEIFKSNWSKCNSQHQQQQQPKTDWFDWNNIIYHISYRVTIITGNAKTHALLSFHSLHPSILWKCENLKYIYKNVASSKASIVSHPNDALLQHTTALQSYVLLTVSWRMNLFFSFFNAKIWVF